MPKYATRIFLIALFGAIVGAVVYQLKENYLLAAILVGAAAAIFAFWLGRKDQRMLGQARPAAPRIGA